MAIVGQRLSVDLCGDIWTTNSVDVPLLYSLYMYLQQTRLQQWCAAFLCNDFVVCLQHYHYDSSQIGHKYLGS